MAAAARLTAELRAETAQLRKDLFKARGQYRRFSRNISNQLRGIAKVASGIGVAAAAGLVTATKQAVALGDEIAKASRNAQIDVESFQSLSFAFELAGSSSAALTKATQFLARAVTFAGDELMTYTRELDRLGLTYEQIVSLSPEESLRLIIQRLREIENPLTRMSTAQSLLGRAGKELGTVLATNAEEFERQEELARRLGLVWEEDLTTKAEGVNDAISTMSQIIRKSLGRAILNVLPAVDQFDERLVSFADAAQTIANDLVSELQELTKWVIDNSETIRNWGLVITGVFGAAFIGTLVTNIIGLTKAIVTMARSMAALGTTAGILSALPVLKGAFWIALAGGIFLATKRITEMNAELGNTADLGGLLSGVFGTASSAGLPSSVRDRFQNDASREVPRSLGLDPTLMQSVSDAIVRNTEETIENTKSINRTIQVDTNSLRIFGEASSRFSGAADIFRNAQGPGTGSDIRIIGRGASRFTDAADLFRNAQGPGGASLFDGFSEGLLENISFSLSGALLQGRDLFDAFSQALVATIAQNLIQNTVSSLVGGIGGLFGLPSAHSGTGLRGLPGRRGQEQLYLGLPGEIVLDPDQSDALRSGQLGVSGGGNQVIQNINGNFDAAILRSANFQAEQMLAIMDQQRRAQAL